MGLAVDPRGLALRALSVDPNTAHAGMTGPGTGTGLESVSSWQASSGPASQQGGLGGEGHSQEWGAGVGERARGGWGAGVRGGEGKGAGVQECPGQEGEGVSDASAWGEVRAAVAAALTAAVAAPDRPPWRASVLAAEVAVWEARVVRACWLHDHLLLQAGADPESLPSLGPWEAPPPQSPPTRLAWHVGRRRGKVLGSLRRGMDRLRALQPRVDAWAAGPSAAAESQLVRMLLAPNAAPASRAAWGGGAAAHRAAADALLGALESRRRWLASWAGLAGAVAELCAGVLRLEASREGLLLPGADGGGPREVGRPRLALLREAEAAAAAAQVAAVQAAEARREAAAAAGALPRLARAADAARRARNDAAAAFVSRAAPCAALLAAATPALSRACSLVASVDTQALATVQASCCVTTSAMITFCRHAS